MLCINYVTGILFAATHNSFNNVTNHLSFTYTPDENEFEPSQN